MPEKRSKRGRIARAVKAKEPQLIEGPKNLLGVRGPRTSQIGVSALHDLIALKKPHVKLLQRKNDIRPFEDASSLEFLSNKNECAAFVFVSHNDKRPHNLVLGRVYDGHILDMLEMGISEFQSVSDFKGPKKMLGAPSCVVFSGEEWERNTDLSKFRNMFLDIFAVRDVTGVALPALDNVLFLGAAGGKVFLRGYFMHFRKSGARVPRVELQPMGPFMDLTMRRTQHAAPDLAKAAARKPAALKSKKVKNVSHDEFGETLGQIHMERQDFSKLELRKFKAAKEKAGGAGAEEGEEDDDEEVGAGSKRPREEAHDDEEEEEEEAAPAPPAAKRAKRA